MRDFRRDQSGSAGLLGPFEGVVMGPKVFHKSLSRLETSQSTPLFPIIFSTAPHFGGDLL